MGAASNIFSKTERVNNSLPFPHWPLELTITTFLFCYREKPTSSSAIEFTKLTKYAHLSISSLHCLIFQFLFSFTKRPKEKVVVAPLKVSQRKRSAPKVHKTFGDRLGALLTARPTKEQLVQQRLLDGNIIYLFLYIYCYLIFLNYPIFKGAVFGVPLENLLDATHPIPAFIDNAITYLEQELDPSMTLFSENFDAEKVKELKDLIDGMMHINYLSLAESHWNSLTYNKYNNSSWQAS